MNGARCVRCAAIHFPEVPVCPECFAETEAVELSMSGRVETWTTVHRAPPQEQVPYVLAWVWTEEGLRVLARWEDSEPRVGTAVELSLSDGERIVARAVAEARA